MKTEPTVVHLKDYQPHPFRISHSDLDFVLGEQSTIVTARHQISRRDNAGNATLLELDCEEMDIDWISIDQQQLEPTRWRKQDNKLVIDQVPAAFELAIQNRINPSANTHLSGLYQSADMLCTQCEAEGFRRITPSIDRPDNLATYRVTLTAAHQRFPVLLSNGNLESQNHTGNQHSVTWYDPFPKPTYLFALVAGSLSELKDTFTTSSGRVVDIHFFARDRDIQRCHFAMDALKRSMAWDEQVYGREYDLDRFNVVAVGDFNMGAMENKSLNIFNTRYVLADAETATDTDFHNVEGVVAHEYFHNWSGNRVTCRDWFQLSLKEGLTVFRDQEFSADMGSRGVQRISDVNVLRNHQFAEDAGPMAHPVRPASYSEINNFYTVTVYEKGAEVVRMLHTLSGPKGFRKGTDLYFDRHDGQAVTTDDFVKAISDATGKNLEQFKNWYSQAGTPEVKVSGQYDPESRTYHLHCTQSCPPTPGQATKQPFVIPLAVALFGKDGKKLYPAATEHSEVLELHSTSQRFSFHGIDQPPVPSVLRGFSAPVKLDCELDDNDLGILFRYDDDPFNRWEAGQKLFENALLDNIRRLKQNQATRYSEFMLDIVGNLITDPGEDFAFTAKLLTLPGESWLGQLTKPVDPECVARARRELKQHIASLYQQPLTELYQWLQQQNNGSTDPSQAALRSLRDCCLDYLGSLDLASSHDLAIGQLESATTMTDHMSALGVLANSTSRQRQARLNTFFQQWKDNDLVVDKWFRVQATASLPDVLDDVTELTDHPNFDTRNPNKIYSLVLAYTQGNPSGFHRKDGRGYDFLMEWVLRLDKANPQVAARLVSGFNGWRDMIPELGNGMKQRLEQIAETEPLSRDVQEIVDRALATG